MRQFRIWWGPEIYASDIIKAETAEDAIVIAKTNFFSGKVFKIQVLESSSDKKGGKENGNG